MDNRLEPTAFHEAGHAITMRLNGLSPCRIVLCRYPLSCCPLSWGGNCDLKFRFTAPELATRIAVSGVLAQSKFLAASRRAKTTNTPLRFDHSQVLRLAGLIGYECRDKVPDEFDVRFIIDGIQETERASIDDLLCDLDVIEDIHRADIVMVRNAVAEVMQQLNNSQTWRAVEAVATALINSPSRMTERTEAKEIDGKQLAAIIDEFLPQPS